MDLYEATYRRLLDGNNIDYNGPSFVIMARVSDRDMLDKDARVWFGIYGIKIDELFLVKAIKLNQTPLREVPSYRGSKNSLVDKFKTYI